MFDSFGFFSKEVSVYYGSYCFLFSMVDAFPKVILPQKLVILHQHLILIWERVAMSLDHFSLKTLDSGCRHETRRLGFVLSISIMKLSFLSLKFLQCMQLWQVGTNRSTLVCKLPQSQTTPRPSSRRIAQVFRSSGSFSTVEQHKRAQSSKLFIR